MRSTTLVSLVASSACLVASAPKPGLRLIKTTATAPAVWVTEDQKWYDYTAKDIDFLDITDITVHTTPPTQSPQANNDQDPEVLQILSTPDNGTDSTLSARAITYPTAVSHQAEAEPLVAQVTADKPQAWLKTMTEIFNRHYLGPYASESATWMFETVKSVAAPNPNIAVYQFPHVGYDQPSVIAQIPGSSTDLIIMAAHFDSIGSSFSDAPTVRAPGAEDNGSGVVAILESLRVLANARFTPKNTIEFHFYAAEEGGKLGSKEIFSNYKAQGKTVLGMVNQDMAGYSPSGKISIYTDYVDAALTKYVRVVAEAYTGETTSDKCGMSCSDHASARSNGFRKFVIREFKRAGLTERTAAAYVCDEVWNKAAKFIHSPEDSYDKVMWDAVLRHAKFGTAFLVEASYL
ncbi:hypothetical protein OQA88_684 [Cercophora sp. LCS_1]